MTSSGHFELSQSRLPDGHVKALPVYKGRRGELLPETGSLQAAIEIIDRNLGREDFPTLEELVNRVGQIISSDQKIDGILIEDEEDLSSVKINRKRTTVSLREKGVTKIPSGLVFDALYVWSESSKG